MFFPMNVTLVKMKKVLVEDWQRFVDRAWNWGPLRTTQPSLKRGHQIHPV